MASRINLAAVMVCAWLVIGAAVEANPFTDFDDGTLQGWEPIDAPHGSHPPFGGILEAVPTGGHPDGFMRATDTVTGGGSLFVAGPAEFQGDLRGYTEVVWDEYLYRRYPIARGTTAAILGADGTYWESAAPVGDLGVWHTRSVPLVESEWTRYGGTASFDEVLSDARLAFNMDCNQASLPSLECGIDNITLVPEPSSVVLMGFAGLLVVRRR